MRIAFLTPEYVSETAPDGGLANYVRTTALGLLERGHEATVIVASDRDRTWSDEGVEVCEVGTASTDLRLAKGVPLLARLHPLFTQYSACRRMARAFWRLHAERPFDIAQASSFRAPGYCLLRNGRVPVVSRASSYTPLLRGAYGHRTTLADRLSDRLERRQVTRADACFAPSRLIANVYARLGTMTPRVIRSHVRVSVEGQDRSFFEKHRPVSRRYLLFFGTLSRIKGVDLIAEIIEPLLATHADLAFVFIGRDDGLPDGRGCMDLVRSCAPTTLSRIAYFPALPKPRLLPFVEGATAIVMPSRVDNYPNTCLEAQALGVPVVGTRDSSIDEMIEDEITGFLATNGDSRSLRQSLERCLAMTQSEVVRMRNAVLAAAKRGQSEDRIGALIDFYEETRRVNVSRLRIGQ
jgi:glycosyltransferase involved in cell wall biosynthesis